MIDSTDLFFCTTAGHRLYMFEIDVVSRSFSCSNKLVYTLYEINVRPSNISKIIFRYYLYLVTPCPVEPCELHKGQNYSIAVHFTEDIEDELTLSLCGYVGPVCVPFPTDTPKQQGISN